MSITPSMEKEAISLVGLFVPELGIQTNKISEKKSTTRSVFIVQPHLLEQCGIREK
jgi:hypothetical protein